MPGAKRREMQGSIIIRLSQLIKGKINEVSIDLPTSPATHLADPKSVPLQTVPSSKIKLACFVGFDGIFLSWLEMMSVLLSVTGSTRNPSLARYLSTSAQALQSRIALPRDFLFFSTELSTVQSQNRFALIFIVFLIYIFRYCVCAFKKTVT